MGSPGIELWHNFSAAGSYLQKKGVHYIGLHWYGTKMSASCLQNVTILVAAYNKQQLRMVRCNYEKRLKQWWSTIPPISTKQSPLILTLWTQKDSLNSNGQPIHKYKQNEQSPLILTLRTQKESLNSDGQQFHQYQ
jgi:hypothetical protein